MEFVGLHTLCNCRQRAAPLRFDVLYEDIASQTPTALLMLKLFKTSFPNLGKWLQLCRTQLLTWGGGSIPFHISRSILLSRVLVPIIFSRPFHLPSPLLKTNPPSFSSKSLPTSSACLLTPHILACAPLSVTALPASLPAPLIVPSPCACNDT
jgi:hypothetical protein